MPEKREAPKVALETLGCKLNQAETEALARRLARAGYRLVAPDEAADIYILNTCTVTHIADRKARQKLRLARRRCPQAYLVAVGCYVERAAPELKAVGVDLVLGNTQKARLPQILEEARGRPGAAAVGLPEGGRTRSFLKVQDGCRDFCAYCIVPLVRGRPECVPADSVVAEVRERVKEGYREVVLTGTEVGHYRDEGLDLAGLLRRVLDETPVSRLRLSSLQPPEITPALIALWQDGRLCPHFHLSLQSGSDGVLARMKRRYTTADYRRAVASIREAAGDAAITTDVIVGFPGETEAEFEESGEFCREMGFARIHVFPYSLRPGTAAAEMAPVPSKIVNQRTKRMLALSEASRQEFNGRFLGRTLEVLWEQKASGLWSGLTDNYIRVYAKSRRDLTNKILPVKPMEIYKDGVRGEVLSGP
jgi:threonylcarbamoyladenosine tRNA methylthiotransferase MtaB